MLYRDNNEWNLCTYRVKYIDNGEELDKYTNSKQWWIDFANKWGNIEILEFIEVDYSLDQVIRLEDVKHIDEGFILECSNYVENGVFPEGVEHPLRNLQLEKENMMLMIASAETYEQMYSENMTLMIALADMYEELQLMKGGNI